MGSGVTRRPRRSFARPVENGGLHVGVTKRDPENKGRFTLIYKRTKNLRAVQLLFGYTKLESTVRYLGIEVDDALEISKQTEI